MPRAAGRGGRGGCMSAPTEVREALRREIEDFLFTEAELLDSWRIEEWFELFTDDCLYWAPGTSDTPDLKTEPPLIYDNHSQLEHRVQRLLSPAVHTQRPRSRTRHFVTNVRIESAGDRVTAYSNFLLYEVRLRRERLFGGQNQHVLRREDGRW